MGSSGTATSLSAGKDCPIPHKRDRCGGARRRGHTLLARRFYSVGGGFVVAGSEENPDIPEVPAAFNQVVLPYRYKHMVELIAFCGRDGKTIPEIVRENERVWRTDEEIDRELDHIWSVMKEAMDRDLRTEGMLPGAYKVARRAAGMKRRLEKISLTDDRSLCLTGSVPSPSR